MELIDAIEQAEETEDRDGGGGIGAAALPEMRGGDLVEPENETQERDAGQQVQTCCQAREQVQAEGASPDEKCAPAASLEPLIFECEAGDREEKDVVVLHHVLRVMEMRGGEKQRQDAGDGMVRCESELTQNAETHERRKNSDKDIGGEADEDVTGGWVCVLVVVEERKVFEKSGDHVLGQHEHRLADAVPALKSAPATVHSEFRVFPIKNGGCGSPKGVGRIESVLGVRSAEFAGLHDERDEARGKSQKEERITKKEAGAVIRPHAFRVSWRSPQCARSCRSLVASFSENFSQWNPLTARGLASAAMKISHSTCSSLLRGRPVWAALSPAQPDSAVRARPNPKST